MGLAIGVLHVRRSILINASPGRVWQEFASFDRFVSWFGRGHELHRYEPRLGGEVELSVEIEGERRHFGGPVLVWEPERELSFENNWHGAHAWPVPSFFTIRLTAVYNGTLVEILHHGFERLGTDAADNLEAYESGWDLNHLAALRARIEPSA